MLHEKDLDSVVATLCRVSREQFADPFKALQWPETMPPEAAWHFTPEWISIHGLPECAALSEGQRRRLAFHEAVNFFSLNIHGEKALIEGLARQLYVRDEPQLSPYLHHFLDEENKHMIYFGRFCMQYAGRIYPDRKFVFPREFAPGEEEFLFFAKVMVFEEIVDVYNKTMAADTRLAPLVRDIHRLHHVDESRHLAFGRAIVRWLHDRYAPSWPAETREAMPGYIEGYLEATWREYYNVDVYQDLGLPDPYGLAERAFANPAARAHRERVSAGCVRYLRQCGILREEATV